MVYNEYINLNSIINVYKQTKCMMFILHFQTTMQEEVNSFHKVEDEKDKRY